MNLKQKQIKNRNKKEGAENPEKSRLTKNTKIMKKQIRVERVNQYGHKHFIEGKMPIVLAELRAEAREKRLSSRKLKNLPISVMSIPKNAHQSELVRIASFEISKMPIDGILRLLNKHGIEKYNIV